ncbi:hypothetical protein RclHR1_10460004 [Rhizophagus clarus]|uniref:HMG box domain-containing protein n=1 Tax=Rhizophagus clarus TaxID=94130 RepID=A0A2Z6Q1M5_9GLOM|nr:hypothetical protein RclHR1_10460004 [Rhizophagus clarus]
MEYTFSESFQSDEQIINESTYKFFLDMNTLLTNREGLSHPPKSQNAFILYRNNKMASPEFKNRPARKKRACDISKEIAVLWNREPENIKSLFRALARIAKRMNSEIYGQRTENEGDETAQETHDLIVTTPQQECYYPSWDGGDGTAQETHDLIVTTLQQGHYFLS